MSNLEDEAREIIYSDDFFKQYADIVPEVGEKLERFVFDIVRLIESDRNMNEKLKKSLAVRIYNSGYSRGHHDTVEGCYLDIHQSDMETYHDDEVLEILPSAPIRVEENEKPLPQEPSLLDRMAWWIKDECDYKQGAYCKSELGKKLLAEYEARGGKV